MRPRQVTKSEGRPTAAERGRSVRRRLLGAAAALVGERGWHGVTTRAVAARAGVAPGLVHYHFESIHALLRQAAVAAMREAVAAVLPRLRAAPTAAEGLDALLAQLEVHDGRDPTSLLFAEAFLAATRDEVLRADLALILDELRRALTGWLADHGDPAPDRTAAVLAATLDGLVLHRSLQPDLDGTAVTPVLRRLLPAAADAEREDPS